MIPEKTSQELNQIFQAAQDKAQQVSTKVSDIEAGILQRYRLLKNEADYADYAMARLEALLGNNTSVGSNNRLVLGGGEQNVAGAYACYGHSLHAAQRTTPYQVFNFLTPTLPLFKDNMSVKINGVAASSHKNLLKHEGIIGRGIYFEEYATPEVVLEIETNPGDLLGDSEFNTIELAPYLAGSFTIASIEIWSASDRITKAETAGTVITNVNFGGRSRILLAESINLWKIRLTFALSFRNSAQKYPFGLQHLYLSNTAYETSSYVVARLDRANYIDWISNEITIVDQFGPRITTCSDEGIGIYTSLTSGGILESQISPSSASAPLSLSRNIKSLYIKIPLRTDRSYYSLTFAKVQDR